VIELLAYVDFESDEALAEVAARLSESLFGGIPFGGLDEYLRDEVPALRLMRDVLGHRVVLHGFGGRDGYSLDIEGRPSVTHSAGAERVESVYVSSLVAGLLSRIEGIVVTYEVSGRISGEAERD